MTMYDVYITYHIINESALYEKKLWGCQRTEHLWLHKKEKIKNLPRNVRNVLNCVTNSYYMWEY